MKNKKQKQSLLRDVKDILEKIEKYKLDKPFSTLPKKIKQQTIEFIKEYLNYKKDDNNVEFKAGAGGGGLGAALGLFCGKIGVVGFGSAIGMSLAWPLAVLGITSGIFIGKVLKWIEQEQYDFEDKTVEDVLKVLQEIKIELLKIKCFLHLWKWANYV